MSKEQIKQIAVDGVKLIRDLLPVLDGTEVRLEYSPESFSDTEVDYALEVCEAVMEAWEPTEQNPIILNLPATVELFTPNAHADQIEWFCRNLKERDKAIISLHTHNDRGTGTAATELGLPRGSEPSGRYPVRKRRTDRKPRHHNGRPEHVLSGTSPRARLQ